MNTDLCDFCEKEKETIDNLFYSCSKVSTFWGNVFKNWGTLLHVQSYPSVNQKNFGDDNLCNLLNYIILSGKRYIYSTKLKHDALSIVEYKNIIKSEYQIEWGIAVSKGKEAKHIEKWGSFPTMLF